MFRLDVCIIIYLLRNKDWNSLSSIKSIDGTRRESENFCASHWSQQYGEPMESPPIQSSLSKADGTLAAGYLEFACSLRASYDQYRLSDSGKCIQGRYAMQDEISARFVR